MDAAVRHHTVDVDRGPPVLEDGEADVNVLAGGGFVERIDLRDSPPAGLGR